MGPLSQEQFCFVVVSEPTTEMATRRTLCRCSRWNRHRPLGGEVASIPVCR